MIHKKLAVAAAAAFACVGAFAEDGGASNIPLSSGTAYFGESHFYAGSFKDVFTFVNPPPAPAWDVSASIVTIDLGPRNIRFDSADLDGHALAVVNDDTNGWAYAKGTFSSLTSMPSTWTLTLYGTTTGVKGDGQAHSYSGTLNVIPVPEPETYALMLAGLGAIGFMARRRRV